MPVSPSAIITRTQLFKYKTYWNLSTQSIPLGSSVEYTKQLNADLNSSPQGPCAIPPRHGQSQLISPVSGLNAPCWPASSSSCSGDFSASSGVATAAAEPSFWGGGGDCAALSFAACSSLAFNLASKALRFSSTIASTVVTSDSAKWGGSVEMRAVSGFCQCRSHLPTRFGRDEARTRELIRKYWAGVVPV